MAYFGGSATESPVPRVDRRVVILALMMFLMALAFAYVIFNPHLISPPIIQEKIVIKEVPVAPKNQEVYVAVSTIWPGQRISQEQLRREIRPIQGLEDRVLTEPSQILNTFASGVIPADTPLLKELVSAVPPANALTARIPPGYRAVTIGVNTESGIEGWVRPGVRVDVIWTTTQRDRQLVTTLVENVQVISAERSLNGIVGEEMQPNQKAVPSHITLLVDSRDAQKIQLAKASGVLSLNLRGDSDTEETGGTTLTFDGILRNRNVPGYEELQGRASFDGKDYEIRAGKLVPEAEVEEEEEREREIYNERKSVKNVSAKSKR